MRTLTVEKGEVGLSGATNSAVFGSSAPIFSGERLTGTKVLWAVLEVRRKESADKICAKRPAEIGVEDGTPRKSKQEGSVKRRIIVDLRRSGAQLGCKVRVLNSLLSLFLVCRHNAPTHHHILTLSTVHMCTCNRP